ncbi:MAG: hypothetical protein AB8G05_04960 [Oligoflexales bacterium]
MLSYIRPKNLNLSGLFFLFIFLGDLAFAQSKRFRKATEDDDVVIKNKLFPKKKKIELAGPDIGLILNQSYVQSFVLHANINYYFNEEWGFTLEGAMAINSDKSERYCIERFYNDFLNNVGSSCPAPGQDPADPLYTTDENNNPVPYKGASFGPAYVPIRELGTILTAAAVWNPVYGKQLAFLTNTVYFDLFITMGGGITQSTYYPKQIKLGNGNISRGTAPPEDEIAETCSEDNIPGACPQLDDSHLAYIGDKGRPEAVVESTPTITLGVGQKFHFKKRFSFKAEIRNYTLLGTASGFDSFFMTWIGLGVRF